MAKYMETPSGSIPSGVRFDVPGRNAGQIVEVAYGGFGRAEHDDGDPHKRVTNRSDGRVAYYKLVSIVRRS